MVSHSSHTNHEFLILVIRVAHVSFAIESFVTYKKSVDNDVTYEEDLPTFKISVRFYSSIWRIYYKLSYEKFC